MNTNIQGHPAARSLDQTQEMLRRSLNRLSSGPKVGTLSDTAAGLAVSKTLDAQNLRVQAAGVNVQNAVSAVQAAESLLGGMAKILARLSELGALASDVAKAPSDPAHYQQEFSVLQDQLRATLERTTSANDGPTVTVGHSVGQEIPIPSSDLRSGAMHSLVSQDASGNYAIRVADSATVGTIISATQQMNLQRAALGVAESQLQLAGNTLQVESENLTSTVARIRDADAAQESTQLASYNILKQSGTAMLAQANLTPQGVLKVLR
jgi:flagellin